jgi:hypothetical protein
MGNRQGTTAWGVRSAVRANLVLHRVLHLAPGFWKRPAFPFVKPITEIGRLIRHMFQALDLQRASKGCRLARVRITNAISL